jgi:hypothetical protein
MTAAIALILSPKRHKRRLKTFSVRQQKARFQAKNAGAAVRPAVRVLSPLPKKAFPNWKRLFLLSIGQYLGRFGITSLLFCLSFLALASAAGSYIRLAKDL